MKTRVKVSVKEDTTIVVSVDDMSRSIPGCDYLMSSNRAESSAECVLNAINEMLLSMTPPQVLVESDDDFKTWVLENGIYFEQDFLITEKEKEPQIFIDEYHKWDSNTNSIIQPKHNTMNGKHTWDWIIEGVEANPMFNPADIAMVTLALKHIPRAGRKQYDNQTVRQSVATDLEKAAEYLMNRVRQIREEESEG